MQLVNAIYFINAATAVAVPATMGSKASTTPIDYDQVMPITQSFSPTLTDYFLHIGQCACKA